MNSVMSHDEITYSPVIPGPVTARPPIHARNAYISFQWMLFAAQNQAETIVTSTTMPPSVKRKPAPLSRQLHTSFVTPFQKKGSSAS